jgi:hypothetical protein
MRSVYLPASESRVYSTTVVRLRVTEQRRIRTAPGHVFLHIYHLPHAHLREQDERRGGGVGRPQGREILPNGTKRLSNGIILATRAQYSGLNAQRHLRCCFRGETRRRFDRTACQWQRVGRGPPLQPPTVNRRPLRLAPRRSRKSETRPLSKHQPEPPVPPSTSPGQTTHPNDGLFFTFRSHRTG